MHSEGRAARAWWLLVAAVFLLAFSVRILGLAYGLPAVYNPDETPILNRALAFAKGDPNPHNFLYPSLYFYAVFGWETLFFLAGRLVGVFDSVAAFQREFFTDPSRLFLAARAFTALCGTLTAVALYVLGKRLYGRLAGLIAALFYAVAPIAVRDAHYVKLDVPVTLLVVLAHASLARIAADDEVASRRRSWIVAGLLGGLAISTHYYVGLIVFSYAAVALVDLRRSGGWQQSAGLLAWAAVGVIAGFLAGTPFLLAEPQTALRDIVAVREIDIDRATVTGGAFVSAGAYLDILLKDAVGWPVFLASLGGAVWALATDLKRGVVLVTFPILFFAFCANTVPMTRYVNAMLPAIALAAAFLLARLAEPVLRRSTVLAPAVTVAMVLAVSLPGLLATLRADFFFRQHDTRTLARQYMEAHVPPGSSVLVQPYSVPLRQSRQALVEALTANLGSTDRASVKFQLQLQAYPAASPTYRILYLGDGGLDPDKLYVSPRAFTGANGLAPLQPRRIDYVVMKRHNTEDPAMRGIFAALTREARLVARFTPYREDAPADAQRRVPPFLHNTAIRISPELERPGPIVEIWRIEPVASSHPPLPQADGLD